MPARPRPSGSTTLPPSSHHPAGRYASAGEEEEEEEEEASQVVRTDDEETGPSTHNPPSTSLLTHTTSTSVPGPPTEEDDDDDDDDEEPHLCLPTETELVLLCLDYLRDLRRAYPEHALSSSAGGPLLHPHYLTMACWALQRAFLGPEELLPVPPGNDAFFVPSNAEEYTTLLPNGPTLFPSLASMEKELLYSPNPQQNQQRNHHHHHHNENHDDDDDDDDYEDDSGGDQKKTDDDDAARPGDPWSAASYHGYAYDDFHISNTHRFYPLAGLASTPCTLGEIAAAGLTGLGARSRAQAERDLQQSPLFQQFMAAVQSKGFFQDHDQEDDDDEDDDDNDQEEKQQRYQERYRKVVAKFRHKLASKMPAEATPGLGPDLLALAAADQHRRQRLMRLQQAARWAAQHPTETTTSEAPDALSLPESSLVEATASHHHNHPLRFMNRSNFASRLLFCATGGDVVLTDRDSVTAAPAPAPQDHPVDLEEAEKFKNAGNNHMQRKEYSQAVECYTQALKLSPAGPHSHVYFSNRAAALVSQKKYHEAILDSERSLALKPDYGKAHARLGLAHFLLGNYRAALEAYTVALKYEPDNASSRNYLEKSAKKLAEQDGPEYHHDDEAAAGPASFSVVSEWEKNHHQKTTTGPPLMVSKSASLGAPAEEAAASQQQFARDREAEKQKIKGNANMASREYAAAYEAYSQAIEFCPLGAQSHVYYSNRAAALCYLERYKEAEKDSLKALSLNPKYSKAHARLGLSRYFLQDYAGAVAAYTASLEYDPTNTASKSYLAKAKAKLAAAGPPTVAPSLSQEAARRLMDDPEFRRVAEKAMNAPDSKTLWDDPLVKSFAKKATSDPQFLAAFAHRK